MATVIRRWLSAWTRFQEQRPYFGQRWVEPWNEVTRAVLTNPGPPVLPREPMYAPRPGMQIRRREPLRDFWTELEALAAPHMGTATPPIAKKGRSTRRRAGRAA